jgi:membrane glycosyltransferase
MLFAPRIAAWTSSRAAGDKARMAGLLLTPEEIAARREEPRHGGEVVPMPVRAVDPMAIAAE